MLPLLGNEDAIDKVLSKFHQDLLCIAPFDKKIKKQKENVTFSTSEMFPLPNIHIQTCM